MTTPPAQVAGQMNLDDVKAATHSGNRPERVAWFRDLGLGLFIHWSMDSQLGMVISHSLVGASADYVQRFFTELPKTFCPTRFDPDEWARLAKVTGFRYVVFTTKHHSGFCMFETATTGFGIMHTPFGRDITREVVEAFRKQGIAIGLYFSPDDFSVLHRQGIEIARSRPEVDPLNNAELMAVNKAQLRELLTDYGPIDLLFFDGQAEGLKQLAWELQPNVVVTRGDMATPEQHIPDAPLPGPWEACLTMGTQWHYKPTPNEIYKPGAQLIQMLIETRAKGGNLLLNVGPKPDGQLPQEQIDRLMELGLWTFVNGEAIYGARSCPVIRDGDVWFTRAQNEDAIYAIVTHSDWTTAEDVAGVKDGAFFGGRVSTYGKRISFTLSQVAATDTTQVSVVGHAGRTLEYRDAVDPSPRWQQDAQGLHISIMSAHRLYNMWDWTNPLVVKITHPAA
jgi:alpha-L-fucosidase